MDLKAADYLRHIFEHKIKIHAYWNPEKRQALAELFGLDEVELRAFDGLQSFITCHGLEPIVAKYETRQVGDSLADDEVEAQSTEVEFIIDDGVETYEVD